MLCGRLCRPHGETGGVLKYEKFYSVAENALTLRNIDGYERIDLCDRRINRPQRQSDQVFSRPWTVENHLIIITTLYNGHCTTEIKVVNGPAAASCCSHVAS